MLLALCFAVNEAHDAPNGQSCRVQGGLWVGEERRKLRGAQAPWSAWRPGQHEAVVSTSPTRQHPPDGCCQGTPPIAGLCERDHGCGTGRLASSPSAKSSVLLTQLADSWPLTSCLLPNCTTVFYCCRSAYWLRCSMQRGAASAARWWPPRLSAGSLVLLACYSLCDAICTHVIMGTLARSGVPSREDAVVLVLPGPPPGTPAAPGGWLPACTSAKLSILSVCNARQ